MAETPLTRSPGFLKSIATSEPVGSDQENSTGTPLLKNYIGGKWVEAECSGHIDVTNPSTGEVIAESPLSTTAETNRAIAAAEEAFKTWKITPASRRVAPLFKLAQLLRDNEEEIARVLTREQGKSLTDSRAEMKRVFENVEVACGSAHSPNAANCRKVWS